MEFSEEGGTMMLEVPSVGRDVSVTIPWAVATDGWQADGSRTEPSRDDLHDWLQKNEARYVAMITARLDPEAAEPGVADDPRVLHADALRHI